MKKGHHDIEVLDLKDKKKMAAYKKLKAEYKSKDKKPDDDFIKRAEKIFNGNEKKK